MPAARWERRWQTNSAGSRRGLPDTLRLAIVFDSTDAASPVSTGASSFNLLIAVGVGCVIGPSDLITFVINNENHANRHERGRDDKNQNPTAQGLNHSTTGRGRLRIAQRAALREGRERGGEHEQSSQPNSNKEERSLDLHLSF